MDHELLSQMVEALRGRYLLYLSVSLTSGRRELQVIHELDCDRSSLRRSQVDLWRRRVLEPNEREAFCYAEIVRARFKGCGVLDPSRLRHPTWEQTDYDDFWLEVIREYASALVVTPFWAFSRGARLEVGGALRFGVAILDLDGNTLSASDVARADHDAREEIGELGLIGHLAPIAELSEESTSSYVEASDARSTAEAVGWLLGEREYQLRKFGTDVDDAHTRQGLNEDAWWWRQLTTYLHRTHVLGLSSEAGRQALAKFAATALGLGESVMRLHGVLWPDIGPLAELERRAGKEADRLFRWVLAERAMASKASLRADDRSLAQGLSLDGEPWHEVMATLGALSHATYEDAASRRAVGRLVLQSVRLLESALRTFGHLPLPGVPSGVGLRAQTA